MIKVYRALPEDYEKVNDMARKAWDETGSPVEISPSAVASLVVAIASNGILQIVKDDDEVIGFAAAALVGLLVNPKVLCASSLAIYVKPEHRGKGAGRLLRRQLELIARQKRIKLMCVPSAPYPIEEL